MGHGRAAFLLVDPNADCMRGPFVYKAFAKVVNYAKYYHGVQAIASKGNEVAARITLPPTSKSSADMVVDPVLIDNFVQVAGIKVNCLNHCPPYQVFICGHIERVQARHDIFGSSKTQAWEVIAHCTPIKEREYKNDIYVFAEDGQLAMVILGVQFTRVAIASLAKILASSNSSGLDLPLQPSFPAASVAAPSLNLPATSVPSLFSSRSSSPFPRSGVSTPRTEFEDEMETTNNLRPKLAKLVAGQLETTEPMVATTVLEDYRLDSLMAVELRAEIESAFGVSLALDDIYSSITFAELSSLVSRQVSPVVKSMAPVSSPRSIQTIESIKAGPSYEEKLAKIVAE